MGRGLLGYVLGAVVAVAADRWIRRHRPGGRSPEGASRFGPRDRVSPNGRSFASDLQASLQQQDTDLVWEEIEERHPVEALTTSEAAARWGLPEGELRRGVGVVLSSIAFRQLARHLLSDTSVELGGLLFGRPLRLTDSEGHLALVTRALPAHGALSQAASLEVGPEAWASIVRQMRQTLLDEPLVGWYHSHPGFGAFLSCTDLRTQELHFSHPWSVALVHDPLRRETKVFLGAQGRETPFLVADLDVQPTVAARMLVAHPGAVRA
ncbi:MAG: Mov34/MPN/PAD-1 family protein [Fimbriimonadales bacterium]|nr:Mov34/MPN/PAD-1 family protein [Fimbriimonadales bacterium]